MVKMDVLDDVRNMKMKNARRYFFFFGIRDYRKRQRCARSTTNQIRVI